MSLTLPLPRTTTYRVIAAALLGVLWLLVLSAVAHAENGIVLTSLAEGATQEPDRVVITFQTPAYGEGVTGPYVRISNMPDRVGSGLLREVVSELDPPSLGYLSSTTGPAQVKTDENQPDPQRVNFSAFPDAQDFGIYVGAYWQVYVRFPGGEIVASEPRFLLLGTPPAPLTRGVAQRALRSAIRETTGSTPRLLKSHCAGAASAYICEPSWLDRKYAYAGTARVQLDGSGSPTVSFKGLRASRSCIRERSVKRCARTFRF